MSIDAAAAPAAPTAVGTGADPSGLVVTSHRLRGILSPSLSPTCAWTARGTNTGRKLEEIGDVRAKYVLVLESSSLATPRRRITRSIASRERETQSAHRLVLSLL
jgi:hypothetical protein